MKTDHPNYRHGQSKTVEHNAWCALMGRCFNVTNPHYARYGGRGISVCDRWLTFEHFYADMGPRPSPQHSVDRKNNDGPYSPENCRWATQAEQVRNRGGRRATINLTFEGRTQCLKDWVVELGLPRLLVENRLRKGWSAHRALTEPIHTEKRAHTPGGWAKH